MSRAPCLNSSLVLLIAFATPANGGPPEEHLGSWKLKSSCPDGKTRHCMVTLRFEKETLKGVYVVDGVEKAAKNVRFEQGVLIVDVDGQYGGQTYGLTYKGKPTDGRIKGSARWTYGWVSGTFAFEGEKITEEVAQAR